MNVALARVLYAHAHAAAPRLALGRFAPLGRLLGQGLYEWSAEELGEPRLLELVRDGNPTYAWPFEQRHVWQTPHMPFTARVLERATKAR